MKIYGLIIAIVLLAGIFAASFALAQEESVQDIVGNTSSIVDDANNLLNDTGTAIDDAKVLGSKSLTLAEGWAISNDNSKAEAITGLWLAGNYLDVSADKVKEVRQQNKGDKAKIKEELQKLSGNVVSFSTGNLELGQGKDKEKFKLVKKDMTNTSVSFYVLPVNEKRFLNSSDAASAAVGTLTLDKKQYPDLTLWTGSLVLNSGNNAGTWNVELASKTKAVKSQEAGKGNQGESNKQEGKKTGFWDKLKFWKKAKNQAG